MATTLARLVRELPARRRARQDRRNRIRKLPKGRRRRELVLAQRKTIARIHTVRNAIMRLRREGAQWGGSRGVTNEVIRFVRQHDSRIAVTSRKRSASDPLSIANPGSDHSGQNRLADAVDFGTASNYALGRSIARHLGGSWSRDYENFYIVYDGRRFRVQIIAGTHGTGPHLHVGVRRA